MTQEDLDSLRYEGAFTEEETRKWLDWQRTLYREKGYGLWAVILKENGAMIGQCGLTMQTWKDQRALEIGYLFNKRYWHNWLSKVFMKSGSLNN